MKFNSVTLRAAVRHASGTILFSAFMLILPKYVDLWDSSSTVLGHLLDEEKIKRVTFVLAKVTVVGQNRPVGSHPCYQV